MATSSEVRLSEGGMHQRAGRLRLSIEALPSDLEDASEESHVISMFRQRENMQK